MVQRLNEFLASGETEETKNIPQTTMRLGDFLSMEEKLLPTKNISNPFYAPTPQEITEWKEKGEIGYFEQAIRQDKTEMIPFNPESAIKSVSLLRAVNRLRTDKYKIDDDREKDIITVNNFLRRKEEERLRGYSIGGKITQGVAALPGFMIEFFATGGLATLGKATVKSAINPVIRTIAKNRILSFAVRNVGATTGAVYRTAAMPHRVTENFAQRQINASLALTESGYKVLDKAREKPHISFMKAIGTTVIENYSEVAGPTLRKMAGRVVPATIANNVAKVFKRLHPNKAVARVFTRAGWDGFLEEWGEERVGDFLRAVTGVEDFGAKDPDSMMDRIISSVPNAEEMLVEAGVLAFPGAMNVGIQQTIDIIQTRKQEQNIEEDEIKELTDKEVDELVKPILEEKPEVEPTPTEGNVQGELIYYRGDNTKEIRLNKAGEINLTTDKSVATEFSKKYGDKGVVNEVRISPDAKILDVSKINETIKAKIIEGYGSFSEVNIVDYAKDEKFDVVDFSKLSKKGTGYQSEIKVLNKKAIFSAPTEGKVDKWQYGAEPAAAIPGEPIAFYDVKGEDFDTAKAQIIFDEIDNQPLGYKIVLSNGQELVNPKSGKLGGSPYFKTFEEAQRFTEQQLSAPTEGKVTGLQQVKGVKPETKFPTQPKVSKPKTLIGWVIKKGGLDPQKLAKDYNIQEWKEEGLLSTLRKGGTTLDDLAQTAINEGIISFPPETTTLGNWFKTKLIENKGELLDKIQESYGIIEKEIEKYYRGEIENDEPITPAEAGEIEATIEKEISTKTDDEVIDEVEELPEWVAEEEDLPPEESEKKFDIPQEKGYTISEGESKYYELSEAERKNLPQSQTGISQSPLKVKFKKQGYLLFPQEVISSPADIAYAFQHLKNEPTERFFVVGTKKGRVVSIEPISIGTINAALVSPFEPIRLLKSKSADSFYLIHNHPSGNIEASIEDAGLSVRFKKAYNKLKLEYGGHIIIDDTKFGFLRPDGGYEAIEHIKPQEKEVKRAYYSKYIEWRDNKVVFDEDITSQEQIFEIAKGIVKDYKGNSLIFYLNSRNGIIGSEFVSPRRLSLKLLIDSATSLRSSQIIVVNSGLDEDSVNDLKEDLDLFEIKLLDSLQIDKEGFKSFIIPGRVREEGKDISKAAQKEQEEPDAETPAKEPLPELPEEKAEGMPEMDVSQTTPKISETYSKDAIEKDISQGEKISNDGENKNPPTPKTELDNYEGKFEIEEEGRFTAFRRVIEDFNIRLKTLTKAIEKEAGIRIKEHLDLWALKDLLPRQQSDIIRRERDKRREFVKMIVADGFTLEQVDEYLLATHAKERNAKMNELRIEKGQEPVDGLSGMIDTHADEILAKADKRLEKYRALVNTMNKETLQFMVDNDLLSQEDADKINSIYKNYVPLFRDVEDDSLGIGAGVDIRGKEIKRAKGSEKRVLSVTGNLFYQSEKAQIRALKNSIGKAIVELTEEYEFLKDLFVVEKLQYLPRYNAEGELIFLDPRYKYADNIIGAKIKGKQYLITINDPLTAQALKNLNLARVPTFIRGLRATLGVWAGFKTRWRPEFLVTNFQRDLGEALINLGVEKGELKEQGKGLRKEILKGLFPAQKELWSYLRKTSENPEVDEFFKLGGDTGHFWAESAKTAEKSLEQLEAEIKNIGWEKIKNPARSAGEFIENLNSVIELGIRYSTYKTLIARGFSKQKAIQSAADLTVNFSRQGEISPFLKSFYGFINPAIQGSSKVIRSLASKEGKLNVAKSVAGLVMFGFLVRVVSKFLDDEGDEMIPDWSKNHKIVISIGDGKQIILWSLPYGFSSFYSLGNNLAELVFGDKTIGEATSSVFNTTVNAFSPFDTNLNSLIPTLAKPIFEVNANKGWYKGQIHPEQIYDRTPGPLNEQYFDNTQAPFLFIAETINRITGGSEGKSGLIDMSPNDFQYLYNQYFGGPFEFMTSSIEAIARGIEGEFEPNKTPFVRQIYREGDVKQFSYNIIYDTLKIVGRKDISDMQKERFFDAVNLGLDNDVFNKDKANKFRQDFLKTIYDIHDIKSDRTARIIERMPVRYREMLINSYSEQTQKTLRKKLR